MYFRQVLHDGKACASYLIGCPSRGMCAVVDSQGDPAAYIHQAQANGMTITAVIETHLHADHISSSRELARLTHAPLYLGPKAAVDYPHQTLADGQTLEIGNRRLTAIHTPGHTAEHISLLVDDWFVLTGDTLFVGDVGRVDLALDDIPSEAIAERALALHQSLQRLMALPEWTEVYPGHYAGSVCGRGLDGKTITTIGRERRANHALQLSPTEFVAFQMANVPALPDDFYTIKRHNLGVERD